ncbi:MAG: hypothetical protein ACI9BW_003078 [Gammaproteobacteria bacterium]
MPIVTEQGSTALRAHDKKSGDRANRIRYARRRLKFANALCYSEITMSDKEPEIENGSETGEYENDEFSRTDHFDNTGPHSRRRRRRKSTKEKPPSKLLPVIGLILFCASLVGVGVLLGSNQQATSTNNGQSSITLENRLRLRQQWLTECVDSGHADWTCDHFDRAHFEAAKQLDHFSCKNEADLNYRCRYALDPVEVAILIPLTKKIDGEYQFSRRRSRTVVGHSDISDAYHVGISESGRIEIRSKDPDKALFVINPATGNLHSLQPVTTPVEE